LSGVGGTGEARLRVGMGELGGWGVVGHGGVSSSPAKAAVELRGSNMSSAFRNVQRMELKL